MAFGPTTHPKKSVLGPPLFRGNYEHWGYRILGTQVRIFADGSWTTCGTVEEHQTNPEYTITCPEITATKLWLYDDTVAEVTIADTVYTDGGVRMIIKEVMVYGLDVTGKTNIIILLLLLRVSGKMP